MSAKRTNTRGEELLQAVQVLRSGVAEEAVVSDRGTWRSLGDAPDARGPSRHRGEVDRMNFRKSSRGRVSRAATSGVSKVRRQPRRKQSTRIRKCMCLPSNYALVEFPVVWSELRSVIARSRN